MRYSSSTAPEQSPAEVTAGNLPNPTATRPTAATVTLWPLHVGAFLATYMFSVSNVAIPAVKTNLGASDSTSALVVGLFSAAFAAGLILCGRIGDRFGRRASSPSGPRLSSSSRSASDWHPGHWLCSLLVLRRGWPRPS